MIDLALDPSETRPAADATQRRAADRPWTKIALFSLLGLAGTGAFASVASTYLSGLAGPQRVSIATHRKASDWPDLKDGLPALATGSLPAIPAVREIMPSEPVRPPVVEARIEPILRPSDPAAFSAAAAPQSVIAGVAADAARVVATKPEIPAAAARPLPAIVDAAVIGPARQANLVPPARTVPGIPPLAGETVRAKTVRADTVRDETGGTAFAALPPEGAKANAAGPAPARTETIKPETKAKPRIEAHAKPAAADKPVAERHVRKPAAVAAEVAPVNAPAQDEDTEVFGIKVPSLAPAGRKIRESVEALGDAVKGIPDRF